VLVLAVCANVAACSDDSPPDTPSSARNDAPEVQSPQAVSSLQSWAQQATAGSGSAHAVINASPPSSPTSDALAPPVIHTVE
jgi:hypothetical protein